MYHTLPLSLVCTLPVPSRTIFHLAPSFLSTISSSIRCTIRTFSLTHYVLCHRLFALSHTSAPSCSSNTLISSVVLVLRCLAPLSRYLTLLSHLPPHCLVYIPIHAHMMYITLISAC